MKQSLIFVLMAALLPSVAFAQLKVGSLGRVTIGNTTDNYYPLTVKGNASDLYVTKIDGYGSLLKMDMQTPSNLTTSGSYYGILINNHFTTSGTSYGVNTYIINSSTSTSSRAIGLMGRAQDGNGTAYGVAGTFTSGNGAGIYGSTSSGIGSITGSYAGYFNGNVKVTGTIDGTLVNSSDARLKEDVQGLDTDIRGTSVLDALESLTPVSFRYKQVEMPKNEPVVDENGEEITEEKEPNPVMEKEHFGLIAQELQEVYPNLVYEKDDGYLAVNYVELVPVLMQAIKELNAKVESLEAAKASRSPRSENEQETLSLPFKEGMGVGSSMDQNVPNPFTEKTDIAIYLPESVQAATLYIYDLSGKQLEQHPITGRGNTVMTIHADRMEAGMYVYSLIADKKVVTTKKMIVVK